MASSLSQIFKDHLRDHDARVSQPWWDPTSPLSHQEGLPKDYSVVSVNKKQNPLYKFHIFMPKGLGKGIAQYFTR